MGILGTLFTVAVNVYKNKDEIIGLAQDRLYQRMTEKITDYGVREWRPSHYGTEDDAYSIQDETGLQIAIDMAEEDYFRDQYVEALFVEGYNLESVLDENELVDLERRTGKKRKETEEITQKKSNEEDNIENLKSKEVKNERTRIRAIPEIIMADKNEDYTWNAYSSGVRITGVRPREIYNQFEVDNYDTESDFRVAREHANDTFGIGMRINGKETFEDIYNSWKIFWNRETIICAKESITTKGQVVATTADGTVGMVFYLPEEKPKTEDRDINDFVLGELTICKKYKINKGLAIPACNVFMRGGEGLLYDRKSVKRVFGGKNSDYIKREEKGSIVFERKGTRYKSIKASFDENDVCIGFTFTFDVDYRTE